MAEHGHLYPGLALVRPSASSFISRQASEPSAAQEAQYHVQAATGDADHPRPSSPPTYPTLQGHHGTRTAARWEDSEIHYSKYLMELLIPLKIMLAKFHVRFSDYRTSQYLQTQMKLLSQSRAGARAEIETPCHRQVRRRKSRQGRPRLRSRSNFHPPEVSRLRHASSRKRSAAFT